LQQLTLCVEISLHLGTSRLDPLTGTIIVRALLSGHQMKMIFIAVMLGLTSAASSYANDSKADPRTLSISPTGELKPSQRAPVPEGKPPVGRTINITDEDIKRVYMERQAAGLPTDAKSVAEAAVAQAYEKQLGSKPPIPAQPAADTAWTTSLYEERTDDRKPSLIDGTVQWSLADGPTAKVELEYPSRGIAANITFRRAQDVPSAAYVFEIAFELADTFPFGGVDSVQRVALKPDEASRGNALIAVPIRGSDKLHLIGLSGSPDAVKANADLLKTRDWIDIPIAYKNGRRALLTLHISPIGHQALAAVLDAPLPKGPRL
jgi:hypothetical protein